MIQTYNVSQQPAVIVFSPQGRIWHHSNNIIQSDLFLCGQVFLPSFQN